MDRSNRKVEYLMTYGWIALVLSVIGLAALGLLSEEKGCLNQIQGFESPLTVSDFSSSEQQLNLTVRNQWPETVQLESLRVSGNSTVLTERNIEAALNSQNSREIEGLPATGCTVHSLEISYMIGNQSYTSEGLLS